MMPLRELSGPARTIFAFGIYLLLLGAVLIVAPNFLLGLFRIAPTAEVWIRVLGMVVLFLGAYYVLGALAELQSFMRWTIPLRASVLIFFLAFVLSGLAPTPLILFGLVDLAGAVWTAWAVWRASARQSIA
jgi:hypothetical protein